MATSQQVIKTLRDAGISEDIIAKKVKELGGTYSPPVSSKSNLSTGISGPEDLIAKTNLPKPGFFEKVGNFLAPTLTANIKDVFASSKSKGYVKSQEQNTQKLLEINKLMKKAREIGDMETYQRLAQESKALGQASETIEEPQFSQYTKDQITRGDTGKVSDYLVRGLKTGAEIGSYLVPAGKGLSFGAKVGLGGASGGLRGFGSSGVGEELGGTIGGTTLGAGFSAAGQGLKWVGKKFTQKAIQASGASENAIIKKFGATVNDLAGKYGKNTDELLGPISEKNRGGTLGLKLKEAEQIIQQTVDDAGSNIRIDGKIITNALKKELNLHKAGLDDEVINGLTAIIKNAEKKYKNGLTAKQALNILRIANSKYGKAMATTPTGSTTKVAQMTIAETMRDTLKQMFPELKDALGTQSEILTLRPIVEKARGSVISKTGQGLFKKGFDVTKPLTYPIVGPMLEATGEKALPMALKGTGAILESPITRQAALGGLNMPTEQAPTTEPMEMGVETGGLPTPEQTITPEKEEPILSPGGQWQWDATQNDWVPYQAETTQGASLTGYTPEELYNASIKAYQAGDKASYSQLMSMYEDETKYQEKQAKKTKGATMTAGQKKEIADFEVSIKQLNSLNTSIDQFKDIMGPVQGRLKTLNPYDTDAQAFNSKMTAVAQIVGKAMEGGVLRKEDTAKYAKMLPQISDTPEVARRKIKNVMEMVELQKQTKQELYSGSENMGDIYTEPVISEEEY